MTATSAGGDRPLAKPLILAGAVLALCFVTLHIAARFVGAPAPDAQSYRETCKTLADLQHMASFEASLVGLASDDRRATPTAATAGLAVGIDAETVDPSVRPAFVSYVAAVEADSSSRTVLSADDRAAARVLDAYARTCRPS